MRTKFLLFILSLVTAVLPDLVKADTVTNLPSADTDIEDGKPDSNFGTDTGLRAGVIRNGGLTRSLFQFDLSAIPANATVTTARVLLTVTKTPFSAANSTFDLKSITDAWDELSVTWNNAPGFASTLSSSAAVTGDGSYTFNSTPRLVSDIQGWIINPANNHGWVLLTELESISTTTRLWDSRESDTPPQLIVTYTVPSLPAAPVINAPSLQNNRIQFSFLAQSNQTYSAVYLDTVNSTNSTVLTNIPAQPSPRTVVISDLTTNTKRFYEVRVP